jgi:hypothetical protein
MAFNAVTGSKFDPAFLARRILTNSLAFSVGECVLSYAAGVAAKGVAGAPILGIIIGFEENDGRAIRPDQVQKGTTAYNGSVVSLTAASNNQTVAKRVAVVCFDPSVIWSAECNGTINTTATSGLPGAGIDVDSANTTYTRVLESTATRTAATITNFVIRANDNGTSYDPADSTRLLVSIQCSEIFSSKKG